MEGEAGGVGPDDRPALTLAVMVYERTLLLTSMTSTMSLPLWRFL